MTLETEIAQKRWRRIGHSLKNSSAASRDLPQAEIRHLQLVYPAGTGNKGDNLIRRLFRKQSMADTIFGDRWFQLPQDMRVSTEEKLSSQVTRSAIIRRLATFSITAYHFIIVYPTFLENGRWRSLYCSCPQEGDLRLLRPPSGQGAGDGARARDRRVPADLRADSLATVLPAPHIPTRTARMPAPVQDHTKLLMRPHCDYFINCLLRT
ncbi:hypothetical protein PoB_003604100 [Plakobranchus ocellatus]|uniref:Uncharacterized protein n=1 Tax=Plakobranchus ocellatus TaxID=259542 RepID=A0AAV4AEA1_9GAST|nr:hypothetical protein PoB_003604100 [Plakobranchus ocellatus]